MQGDRGRYNGCVDAPLLPVQSLLLRAADAQPIGLPSAALVEQQVYLSRRTACGQVLSIFT